ncbi:MAG: sugar-binding domain-containing protein, partial [Chloroflexia bacterium]
MKKQVLNGDWQFRQAGSEEWLVAEVPGGVHTDLLRLGLIPDPFVGDNEKMTQWVAETDWEYSRTWTADAALLAMDRVFLVCDGLDTLADVWVNGQLIGKAENMFRHYRWDVREIVKAGENQIKVAFRSPVRYAIERNEKRPMPDVNNPLAGGPYLRKAPSHFGWDWGPRLPAVGIWQEMRLEGYNSGRLTDVHVRQKHVNGAVMLSVAANIERYDKKTLTLSVRLTGPDGRVQEAEAKVGGKETKVSIDVAEPQLWWPNDLGEQALYGVEVELKQGELLVDQKTYQVGFRTVELRQEKDEWGESFTFVINGVPVFGKGSNWIPADTFNTRITHSQLDHLLGSAAAAHHNMVRVWGGGFYESEDFYDLCDKYGLLVWQDFQFACAGYPLDEKEYLENVHGEVRDNIRRLRHRASLVLWCGNNEIESAWAEWGWNKPVNAPIMKAYEKFFHHILPGWVKEEDSDSAYWPSSPSSGDCFKEPNGLKKGDIHQWAVWHANKPFSQYRDTPARFVSEFGFQSLPELETIKTFAEEQDWNITSYIMEHHQRSPVGNEKIILYMLEHFRLPKDFESLVYLSQLLQLEAMRTGVEFWRRHPATSGALYWQLNDCWPVISWAGIDYYGRWKALHYASKRFFAPVMLSVDDAGTSMDVYVTNDGMEAWEGEVRWSLETLEGEVVDSGEAAVSAKALVTTLAKDLDFAGRITDANKRELVLVAELWREGERLQWAVATFSPTKHVSPGEPNLNVEV